MKKSRKGKLFESGTKPVAPMVEFCLIINKKTKWSRTIATLTTPTNCPVSDRYKDTKIQRYICIYLQHNKQLQKIAVEKYTTRLKYNI